MSNIFSTTVVILRIYAAYILVNSSLSAAAFFLFVTKMITPDQAIDTYMAAAQLGTLSLMLLSFCVFIYAKKIASYITRDLEYETLKHNDNYETLQAVGFSLLGMYLLMHTVPVIVKIIASYVFPSPNNKYDVLVMPSGYKTKIPLPDILEVITQLGIGLCLLIGAKGIVMALRRAWAKGRILNR